MIKNTSNIRKTIKDYMKFEKNNYKEKWEFYY